MLWYEDEIQRLEKERATLTYTPDTLFYGSSSIRQWTDLGADFNKLKPANLGFGGSTLAACAWFFDRITAGYQPEKIIVYAGDNDLADGRHPQEVCLFFKELVAAVSKKYGSIPCYFVSLKPSIARWMLIEQFEYTNEIIKEEINHHPDWTWVNIFTPMLNDKKKPDPGYFIADGLHLNKKVTSFGVASCKRHWICNNRKQPYLMLIPDDNRRRSGSWLTKTSGLVNIDLRALLPIKYIP